MQHLNEHNVFIKTITIIQIMNEMCTWTNLVHRTNIGYRLDDMETGMTRGISAAAKKAEAALELASQSRAELEEMRIEMAELKKWCKKTTV